MCASSRRRPAARRRPRGWESSPAPAPSWWSTPAAGRSAAFWTTCLTATTWSTSRWPTRPWRRSSPTSMRGPCESLRCRLAARLPAHHPLARRHVGADRFLRDHPGRDDGAVDGRGRCQRRLPERLHPHVAALGRVRGADGGAGRAAALGRGDRRRDRQRHGGRADAAAGVGGGPAHVDRHGRGLRPADRLVHGRRPDHLAVRGRTAVAAGAGACGARRGAGLRRQHRLVPRLRRHRGLAAGREAVVVLLPEAGVPARRHADPARAAAAPAGADQLRAAVRDDGLRAGTDRLRPPRSAAAGLAAGLAGRAAGDAASRVRRRRAPAAGDGWMTAVPATLRTAIANGLANRTSFWFQVSLMVANDITWIVFWVLFFHQVGNLRGWDAHDVIVLFSILLTTAGVALGLCANSRKIGQLSADGALDETLTLPVPPLAHLLSTRVDAANTGDLLLGPVLFWLAGNPSPERAAMFLFGVVAGSVVLIGCRVAGGSLTSFVGGRGEQADLGFNAILIFASYPLDLFGGATKMLLFTAVPAAFVTGVPARLVRNFDTPEALLMVAVAALFAMIGWGTFHLGLRHYSSGSIWIR